jgi:uncharacterized OB-fold protein
VSDPTSEGPEDVGPTRRYQDGLRLGRITYQRCESCSAAVFPPRVLCHVCSSQALRWESSAGAGTLYSASTLTPRDEHPYTVVLVDLDEGFRVMSTVAGTEAPLGGRVQLSAQPAGDPPGEPRLVAVLVGGSGE